MSWLSPLTYDGLDLEVMQLLPDMKEATKSAIELAGCTRGFQPTYSPDLTSGLR